MYLFVFIIINVFCKVYLLQNVTSNMEEKIGGGRPTSILNYPFAALLAIYCQPKSRDFDEDAMENYICGSTIVNQYYLVTAGHCLEACHPYLSYINIAVGTEHANKINRMAQSFETHWDYEFDPVLKNDIGLVRVDVPLKLGKKVMRAIIMRDPPEWDFGYVSGWGVVDQKTKKTTKYLKAALQSIPDRSECLKVFPRLVEGAFCSKEIEGDSNSGYALVYKGGDSGSGFVVNRTIVIGLVSYKRMKQHWTVYANLTHHYDWMTKMMTKMECSKGKDVTLLQN